MRSPATFVRSDAACVAGSALLHSAALLALVHGARPLVLAGVAALVLFVMLTVGVVGVLLPFFIVRWEMKRELAHHGVTVPQARAAVRARMRRVVPVPLLGR